jgi:hypothetical protein
MNFTQLNANNYMSTVANEIDIESLKAQAPKTTRTMVQLS